MAFHFEDQVLDPVRRELVRGGRTIPVEPKVFDLLLCLIEQRHRLLTKDDLIAQVWDGRVVSDSALTSAINAARTALGDDGRQQRLIRTSARKGVRFVGEIALVRSDSQLRDGGLDLALPAKPSIAVLPFQNMSGDRDQEYFVDGLVEDIITALSHFKSLFVIARNSSFTYKGRATDVRQVSRDLGVRYVLEGSVRKTAEKVRITGQLIDCEHGVHLWADRFDGPPEDVFTLQDHVTASVVGAILPRLDKAEIERARRRPVEVLDAYDCYLRGMAASYVIERKAQAEAHGLFYRAIELDPDFAAPYGMAARSYHMRKSLGWLEIGSAERAEVERLAAWVSAHGRDDALALCWVGHVLVRVCYDDGAGAPLVDQALALNPNLAVGWVNRGAVSVWQGQHDAAIEQLMRALRLSPVDPENFRSESAIANAYLGKEQFDEAARWAKRAAAHDPKWLAGIRTSAAAEALAGNIGEARRRVEQMRQLFPSICIAAVQDNMPYGRKEDIERILGGLRLAGLPE